jgi:hypothetical protein
VTSTLEAAAALCTTCGACCNGTLFDEVPLEREEIALGPRLSLPIVACGDAAAMPLPCPRLHGASCTIYPERPSTCRTYRCGLLAALEAGQVELDDALARVAALRDASSRLRALLPRETSRLPVFRAVENVATALGGRRSAAFVEGRSDLVTAVEELGRAMRAVTRDPTEP